MHFNAYCPYCEKTVNVVPDLSGDDLKDALTNDQDIRVTHIGDVDHAWTLIRFDKETLRKAIANAEYRGFPQIGLD